MAEDLSLVRDLALILVTAGVTALIFHRLRMPLVLGYLAAGVLVGPHVSPFPTVSSTEDVSVLAQVGVIFLLFSLGLHFHLGQLRRVGGTAILAGVLEVSLLIAGGFLVGRLFGWRPTDALFLGAILAISSTTVIVKVLGEQGRLREPGTQVIFGILVVADLVAVLLIALLSSIALTGTVTAEAVALVFARVAIFVIATLVLGLVVVPRLVDHVAKRRVEEVLVLLVVGIAFAVAMLAVSIQLSLALGAFMAGALVAESRASATVERRIAPLRDVFAAVFFVSTGILLDPADVLTYWRPILLLGLASIAGKIAAVGLATFVAGHPPREAIRVGVGMAMIGEFSFVIAGLGSDLGVTSPFLLPIAVSVSALTTLVTPFLIRRSDGIARLLGRLAPRPARDLASTYSAWVTRAKAGSAASPFAAGADVASLVRVGAYGALLVTLAVAARLGEGMVAEAFPGNLWVRIGVYALLALASLPVAVGFVRAVRRLLDRLVATIVPAREERRGGRGAAAAAVLRATLTAFLVVLLGAILLATGAAFLPTLPLLLGGLVVVLAAAFLLRGALRKLDQQLEEAVETVFSGKGAPPGSRDQVLSMLRQRYPWDLHVRSVIVPFGAQAANRRLRDLHLPQKTGAVVVTHERDGATTANPGPDTLILPGDTLGILGEALQVEEAQRYLTTEGPAASRPQAHADEVDIEEMEVQAGAPIAGLTLAGSRIRETTGASIVGVRREGVPILNPAPVLRLTAGDEVVVLGTTEQLAAARRLFEASSG